MYIKFALMPCEVFCNTQNTVLYIFFFFSSENDVAIMRNSQFPASKLLENLEEKAIDVRTLQNILLNCRLYDAHSALLTNGELSGGVFHASYASLQISFSKDIKILC